MFSVFAVLQVINGFWKHKEAFIFFTLILFYHPSHHSLHSFSYLPPSPPYTTFLLSWAQCSKESKKQTTTDIREFLKRIHLSSTKIKSREELMKQTPGKTRVPPMASGAPPHASSTMGRNIKEILAAHSERCSFSELLTPRTENSDERSIKGLSPQSSSYKCLGNNR